MKKAKKSLPAGQLTDSASNCADRKSKKIYKPERKNNEREDLFNFQTVFAAEPGEAEWVRRAGYRLLASWLLSKCWEQEGSGGEER